MKLFHQLQYPLRIIRAFIKWVLLSSVIGVVGGLLGAAFHHALHFVTEIRGENPWLIWLLPVGGLLTIGLYRLFRMTGNRGTNEIIEAILDDKPINPLLAPTIFLASCTTHLFGGSAGREGAALQLGGSVASGISKLLKLQEQERTVLIISGMSAVFAGLFGTPLTACLFTMEFESLGTIFSPALLPCFLSAFIASGISGGLGVHAETYLLETALTFTMDSTWRLAVLAILVGLLGIVMCTVFHKAEHLAAKAMPNPMIRIAVGGAVVTALTLLVGDQRYNGAGMDMALGAVAGNANWYDFLLKMLFTAVTLAAGFKGGEIVPTFCIGATFGCVVGGLLGLDPGIAAALGLVGLFCGATNSPITSIILSIEMFGVTNLYPFVMVCVISFVLAVHWSLYSSQSDQFYKSRFVRNRD